MKLDYYDNDVLIKTSDTITDFIENKEARNSIHVYEYFEYELPASEHEINLFVTGGELYRPSGILLYCVTKKVESDVIHGVFLVKDGIIDKFISFEKLESILEGAALLLKELKSLVENK